MAQDAAARPRPSMSNGSSEMCPFPHAVWLPTTETKNHWARDDPGFAVLQAFFLVVSAFFYAHAGYLSSSHGFAQRAVSTLLTSPATPD